MISILRRSAYKYGYLFIAAAWLYTVSFLFTNYFSFDSSPQKVAKTLSAGISKHEKYFNGLLKDSVWTKKMTSGKAVVTQSKLKSDETGIFVYRITATGNAVEIFWNTNTMTVNDSELQKPDGYYATSHANGFFELIKRTVVENDKQYAIVGMIPIYWAYNIEYEDLQRDFAGYNNLGDNYTMSSTNYGSPVVNSAGATLFYVQKKENSSLDQPGTASILLRVIAIVLLMIFINALASELAAQSGFFTGFLFFVIVVAGARSLTYFFPFPFDYRALSWFDPTVYASSGIHRSLGDLLINSVLIYWFVTFVKFNVKRIRVSDKLFTPTTKKIVGILSLFLIPLLTIAMAGFLTSIVKDSNISFNVTNFFAMSVYTIVSFVIMCFLLLSFFYISQLLVQLSFFTVLSLYWRIVVLLSFTFFFLSLKLIGGNNDTLLNFSMVGWLLFFYVFINIRKDEIPLSFYSSPSFMPWSIFLIASVSALLIYQNKSIEFEKRKTIAEKIYTQSDASNETLLAISLSRFSQYLLDNRFIRFYAPSSNKALKDSINRDLAGYLTNFDTRIYTYDKDLNPLYNQDSVSYDVIKSIIINQGKFTITPDLYYYENAADKFSYIYEKNVYSADSSLQGYVYLIIRPKAYEGDELTPLLFRQLTKNQPLVGDDYLYAIYDNYRLKKSSGNYDFPDVIDKQIMKHQQYLYRERERNNELWYNAGNNKIVIVARKNDWFPESITFFAYLFGILIIVVLLQHFSYLVLRTHFKWDEIKRVFRFNIRTQIQTIIVTVSVISFLVIGVATISFFISRFNLNNEEKLRNNAQIIVTEIVQLLKSKDSTGVFNHTLDLATEQKIVEIGEMHNTDINFFDVNGNLQVSSQQYIYDNQILSKKMQPYAFNALKYEHSTQHIQEENIVNFHFISIYVPVKNEKDVTIAYLNLPFINSQNELHQEISNFVVTLINLNALIFILAGGIALWITRRITSSFTLIRSKMRAINFGSDNEEIEWKKDDELGELIIEYNKMVKKLAESAQALARSEREGAWREMARQVAHEIKNPLTPMKLSIQYLQRAIDNNASNVKDLSRQVASTLIEQIDQLSKIAGDFSQFANIANVRKQTFDVSDVLEGIINLFSADERVNIIFQKEDEQFFIEADKTQINRLFTNLVKNAIEAYEIHESATIVVLQYKQDNNVIISIEDRGHGIPPAMQQKIFAPNFTTKSSGTGLGLAICKGIVEKANGSIWFETKENEGTVFYVSLPLVHQPEPVTH